VLGSFAPISTLGVTSMVCCFGRFGFVSPIRACRRFDSAGFVRAVFPSDLAMPSANLADLGSFAPCVMRKMGSFALIVQGHDAV
jgi:hypothetical protein